MQGSVPSEKALKFEIFSENQKIDAGDDDKLSIQFDPSKLCKWAPSDVNLATCYILLLSTYCQTSYNITYGRGPRTTVKVGGKLTTQAQLLFPVYAHHCTVGFSF